MPCILAAFCLGLVRPDPCGWNRCCWFLGGVKGETSPSLTLSLSKKEKKVPGSRKLAEHSWNEHDGGADMTRSKTHASWGDPLQPWLALALFPALAWGFALGWAMGPAGVRPEPDATSEREGWFCSAICNKSPLRFGALLVLDAPNAQTSTGGRERAKTEQ